MRCNIFTKQKNSIYESRNVAHLRRAWAICSTARRGQPVTLDTSKKKLKRGAHNTKSFSDVFISVLPTRW